MDTDSADSATASGHRPHLVLLHGLEGSSDSHYARATMARCAQLGWQGTVIHWRGCGGTPNRLPRAYHSGDSAEADWMLRRLEPDFVCGISLGGNVLLKWLGEMGLRGERPSWLRAAAAISAPHDLKAGAMSLDEGFNRIYRGNFLKTLRRKSLQKLTDFPDIYDAQRVRRARSFAQFDGEVTARLHGFDSAEHYWAESSCKQFLHGIHVPTLVLNATNDPFIPAASLATPDQVSDQVHLEYPAEGGHAGFPCGAFPGGLDWMPERITRFFGSYVGANSKPSG